MPGDVVATEEAKTVICTMLAELQQLWPRDQGQGWQTSKHHEQLHVPDDINSLGAHRNYFTESSEHNHIDNIKRLAKMTQGHKSVLDWKIGNCRAESYILDLAFNDMSSRAPSLSTLIDHVEPDGIVCNGAKGVFVLYKTAD
jgi:hypothetical protein